MAPGHIEETQAQLSASTAKFWISEERKKINMEEEVCTYAKVGFCKFRESCKRKHFTEINEDHSRCTEIKECKKNIPKYVEGFP